MMWRPLKRNCKSLVRHAAFDARIVVFQHRGDALRNPENLTAHPLFRPYPSPSNLVHAKFGAPTTILYHQPEQRGTCFWKILEGEGWNKEFFFYRGRRFKKLGSRLLMKHPWKYVQGCNIVSSYKCFFCVRQDTTEPAPPSRMQHASRPQVGLAAAGGGVLLFLSGGVAAPSVTASLSAVGYVRRFCLKLCLCIVLRHQLLFLSHSTFSVLCGLSKGITFPRSPFR